MLSRLTGTLESIAENTATLVVSDSAYELLLPAYLAERLASRVGERLTLTTLQYLDSRDQGATFTPRLLGFAAPRDRAFFELFTTVKGIGNRKAMRAMAREPAVIARAIAERDIKGLQALPEIGKRLAETIIAELHGKVEPYLSDTETTRLNAAAAGRPNIIEPKLTGPAEEAVAVLMNLGETRADALRLIAKAIERLQDSSAAAGNSATPPTADQLVASVFAAR